MQQAFKTNYLNKEIITIKTYFQKCLLFIKNKTKNIKKYKKNIYLYINAKVITNRGSFFKN